MNVNLVDTLKASADVSFVIVPRHLSLLWSLGMSISVQNIKCKFKQRCRTYIPNVNTFSHWYQWMDVFILHVYFLCNSAILKKCLYYFSIFDIQNCQCINTCVCRVLDENGRDNKMNEKILVVYCKSFPLILITPNHK